MARGDDRNVFDVSQVVVGEDWRQRGEGLGIEGLVVMEVTKLARLW